MIIIIIVMIIMIITMIIRKVMIRKMNKKKRYILFSFMLLPSILFRMSEWNFLCTGQYLITDFRIKKKLDGKFLKPLIKTFEIWLLSLKKHLLMLWTLVTLTVTISILCLAEGDSSSKSGKLILSQKRRSFPLEITVLKINRHLEIMTLNRKKT